jgi:hypothetical protein
MRVKRVTDYETTVNTTLQQDTDNLTTRSKYLLNTNKSETMTNKKSTRTLLPRD